MCLRVFQPEYVYKTCVYKKKMCTSMETVACVELWDTFVGELRGNGGGRDDKCSVRSG